MILTPVMFSTWWLGALAVRGQAWLVLRSQANRSVLLRLPPALNVSGIQPSAYPPHTLKGGIQARATRTPGTGRAARLKNHQRTGGMMVRAERGVVRIPPVGVGYRDRTGCALTSRKYQQWYGEKEGGPHGPPS